MSESLNFRISSKDLDLDELGVKLDHLTVPQDLKDASADCISISMAETAPQKISSLMDYLDSLDQEDEVADTFWKTRKSHISGFLKYRYENDKDESIILFLDQKKNKNFYEDCDLIDLSISDNALMVNAFQWIIVDTDPLIIMNGDGLFFSFINTESSITQVVLYHAELDYGYGGSTPQEVEARSVKRYIRDPHKP